MPLLHAPFSRTKPSLWAATAGQVSPEWRPYWRGLIFCAPVWEGNGLYVYDLIRHTRGERIGDAAWRVGAQGPNLYFDRDAAAGNCQLDWAYNAAYTATGACTVLTIAQPNVTNAQMHIFRREAVLGANVDYAHFMSALGKAQFSHVDGAGNSATYTSTLDYTANAINVQISRRPSGAAGQTVDIFLNSSEHLAITPSENRVPGASTGVLQFGDLQNNTIKMNGYLCAVWNVALTREQCRMLAANPYGFITPMHRQRAATAAAPAAAPISPYYSHYYVPRIVRAA